MTTPKAALPTRPSCDPVNNDWLNCFHQWQEYAGALEAILADLHLARGIPELPTYEVAKVRVKSGDFSAIDIFIYRNEPAGRDAGRAFREQLSDALRLYAVQKDAEVERLDALQKSTHADFEQATKLIDERDQMLDGYRQTNANLVVIANTAEQENERLRGLALKDPIVRMNNIVEALEHHKADSPYTEEAWVQVDEDNKRLRAEVAELKQELAIVEEDLKRVQQENSQFGAGA